MPKTSSTNTRVTKAIWEDRIVGSNHVPVSELLAHPMNFRIHGAIQQSIVGTSIDEIGWVRHILVNSRTGFVVDGHLRVTLAYRKGGDTLVPVDYVELSDAEEAYVLSMLDETVGLAYRNETKREDLFEKLQGTNRLTQVLAEIAKADISFRKAKYGLHVDGQESRDKLLSALADYEVQIRTSVGELEVSDDGIDVADFVLVGDAKDVAFVRNGLKRYSEMSISDNFYKIVLEWKERVHASKKKKRRSK